MLLSKYANPKYIFLFSLVLCTLTYVLGINLGILGVDASLYASISQQMSESGSYLQVYHNHADYLDKPPLLFWLSSLSFQIFGIHNWSYRLPSLIFLYIGIYSTFRLGKLLYSQEIGFISATIFMSSQAVFLITHDVRTDLILIGSLALSMWALVAFIEQRKIGFVLLGFVGIALAMLTKGPIGLMLPILACGTHILITRKWQVLWRWEWLLGILVLGVLLFPMVIGLYQQFDLHPEKTIVLSSGREVQGQSGLYFYFWEQSFGRLTGASEWNNHLPWHFFLGILMWSFFPWSLVAIGAIYSQIKNNIKSGKNSEFYLLGAVVLPFIFLSASKYKLDHYIYIIYPFLSILCAKYLIHLVTSEKAKTLLNIQRGLILIACAFLTLLQFFVFDTPKVSFIVCILLLFIAFSLSFILGSKKLAGLLFATVLAVSSLNIYLKTHFFTSLESYDSGMQAGLYLRDSENSPTNSVYTLGTGSFGLSFYSGVKTSNISAEQLPSLLLENVAIFTDENGLRQIKDLGFQPSKVVPFKEHNTTMLKKDFLLIEYREKTLEKRYLVFFKD